MWDLVSAAINASKPAIFIIVKMIVGIKAHWQEGKTYNLTNNVFTDKMFITSDISFSLKIQALVQSSNCILADIEQSK